MAERLVNENSLAYRRLEELKRNGIALVVTDYDGTINGTGVSHQDSAQLIVDVAHHTLPAVVTARGATFMRDVMPYIASGLTGESTQAAYISITNGQGLFRVDASGIAQVYFYLLHPDHADHIAKIYEDVFAQLGIVLPEERDLLRKKDLAYEWGEIIPQRYLDIARAHTGVWVEQSKVSLLTDGEKEIQVSIVQLLQEKLGSDFVVKWGGKPVIDVTLPLPLDGKVYVTEQIQAMHQIDDNNIAAFGDTPDGNDEGLLRRYHYSFTNIDDQSRLKGRVNPPYILPDDGLLSVARVHKAIHYLIT